MIVFIVCLNKYMQNYGQRCVYVVLFEEWTAFVNDQPYLVQICVTAEIIMKFLFVNCSDNNVAEVI